MYTPGCDGDHTWHYSDVQTSRPHKVTVGARCTIIEPDAPRFLSVCKRSLAMSSKSMSLDPYWTADRREKREGEGSGDWGRKESFVLECKQTEQQ
jgi:hypothetical protein